MELGFGVSQKPIEHEQKKAKKLVVIFGEKNTRKRQVGGTPVLVRTEDFIHAVQ